MLFATIFWSKIKRWWTFQSFNQLRRNPSGVKWGPMSNQSRNNRTTLKTTTSVCFFFTTTHVEKLFPFLKRGRLVIYNSNNIYLFFSRKKEPSAVLLYLLALSFHIPPPPSGFSLFFLPCVLKTKNLFGQGHQPFLSLFGNVTHQFYSCVFNILNSYLPGGILTQHWESLTKRARLNVLIKRAYDSRNWAS